MSQSIQNDEYLKTNWVKEQFQYVEVRMGECRGISWDSDVVNLTKSEEQKIRIDYCASWYYQGILQDFRKENPHHRTSYQLARQQCISLFCLPGYVCIVRIQDTGV